MDAFKLAQIERNRYDKYAIGQLAYTTGFNTIKFMIGGVFKSK